MTGTPDLSYRKKYGHAIALILWAAPLVFPTIGFCYLGVKIADGEAFGVYSISLFVLCAVWYIATLSPLCIGRYRRAICARRLHLMTLYLAICFALVIAELLMTTIDAFVGLPPCRPITPSWWSFYPDDQPKLAKYFIADSVHGSRYNWPDDPNFNRQGFRDRDDFTSEAVSNSPAKRLLLIGDSFAYGVAAINDGSNSGFADLLEDRMKKQEDGGAIVWNTAIPGIGQREQTLHLKKYLPLLKPQIVLLAFYEGNDLEDNVSPMGRYYVFEEGTWADRYSSNGQSRELISPRKAWLRSQSYGIEPNSFLLTLRTTSTAYRLFKKSKDRIDHREHSRQLAIQFKVTQKLLEEISSTCEKQNVKLRVVVIPKSSTVAKNSNSETYEAILKMFKGLSIKALDMRPYFTQEDYAPAPDLHWNKAGHRKAADAIFEFLDK